MTYKNLGTFQPGVQNFGLFLTLARIRILAHITFLESSIVQAEIKFWPTLLHYIHIIILYLTESIMF